MAQHRIENAKDQEFISRFYDRNFHLMATRQLHYVVNDFFCDGQIKIDDN